MKRQKRTIWEHKVTLMSKYQKGPLLALGYLLALIDSDIITLKEYKTLYSDFDFSSCFTD